MVWSTKVNEGQIKKSTKVNIPEKEALNPPVALYEKYDHKFDLVI